MWVDTYTAIKTPRVMRAVFFMLLAAIVITLAFLIYVPWVQTTSGRGVVTYGWRCCARVRVGPRSPEMACWSMGA